MNIFKKKDRRDWSLGYSIYYHGTSIEDIQKKIHAGGDVNSVFATDYEKHPLIRWAAERGREDTVQLLVSSGADPNAGGSDHALMAAVERRHNAVAEILIKSGAKVDTPGLTGETPLLMAVRNGSGEMVKLLVEQGANVNFRMKDGTTALHYAASRGYANLSMYLIEKGADVNAINGNFNTAADVAEKEYPGLAAQLRKQALSPQQPAVETASEWKLLGAQEVARVTAKTAIGYQITEIFNFSAHTYTQIATNIETRAESQALKAFSELEGGDSVDEAHRALISLGGQAKPPSGEKKKLQIPSP